MVDRTLTDPFRFKVILLFGLIAAFLIVAGSRLYLYLETEAQRMSCRELEDQSGFTLYILSPSYRELKERCPVYAMRCTEILARQGDPELEANVVYRSKKENCLDRVRAGQEAAAQEAERREAAADSDEACMARLAERLRADVARNRYRDAAVDRYVSLRTGVGDLYGGSCTAAMPDPYRIARRSFKLAVPLDGGAALLLEGDDRVWYGDTIYYVTPEREWFCLWPDCRDERVDVPPSLVQAYEEVAGLTDERLALHAGERARAFYEAENHNAAWEVASYAVRLDPASDVARWNAAAFAAQLGRMDEATAHLDSLQLSPDELLDRVREHPAFERPLRSDRYFRRHLYETVVQPAMMGELAGRFETELETRYVECEPDDPCEGIKEFHAHLYLKRSDSDWRVLLRPELQNRAPEGAPLDAVVEQIHEDVWMRAVDGRLLVNVAEEIYEVPYPSDEVKDLGRWDYVGTTDRGYPLVLSRFVGSSTSVARFWVYTYSGEPGSQPEERGIYEWNRVRGFPFDFSYIDGSNGTFVLVDPVSGDRYQLQESN